MMGVQRMQSSGAGLGRREAQPPEAALTGYVSARGDFDLAPVAEPLEGPTGARLSLVGQPLG